VYVVGWVEEPGRQGKRREKIRTIKLPHDAQIKRETIELNQVLIIVQPDGSVHKRRESSQD
jgi:hypothetical protein